MHLSQFIFEASLGKNRSRSGTSIATLWRDFYTRNGIGRIDQRAEPKRNKRDVQVIILVLLTQI